MTARCGSFVMGRRMFDEGEVSWPENARSMPGLGRVRLVRQRNPPQLERFGELALGPGDPRRPAGRTPELVGVRRLGEAEQLPIPFQVNRNDPIWCLEIDRVPPGVPATGCR